MDTSEQIETINITIENEQFEVPKMIVNYSKTLKEIFEDTIDYDVYLPLMRIKKLSLIQIIDFYDWYDSNKSVSNEDLKIKIDQIFSVINLQMMNDLLISTDYLGMELIHNICCEVFANRYIKGKSTTDMREVFNIDNDLSEEDMKEHF